MKPVEFPEHNAVLAKDQPQYHPLPVYRDQFGLVVSCWKLTRWERIKLLFSGRIWLMQLTFNEPLQPQLPQLESPFDLVDSQPVPEWVTADNRE